MDEMRDQDIRRVKEANPTKVLVVGAGDVGMGSLEALVRIANFDRAERSSKDKDMIPYGMATRRPGEVRQKFKEKGIQIPVFGYDDLLSLKEDVDIAVLCQASQDLPKNLGPDFARQFNSVDSFDDHPIMPYYVSEMDKAARENSHIAGIGFGWDPGESFSTLKLMGSAHFPYSATNVFYGPGKSQGHTTALKVRKLRDLGIVDAIQFTRPILTTTEKARKVFQEFPVKQRIWRNCYVTVREGTDNDEIRKAIHEMPRYYEGYKTRVTFVPQERLDKLKQSIYHQGRVITHGRLYNGSEVLTEYSCFFEDNARATACFLVGAARALHRLYLEGKRGAVVPGDIPRNLFSPLSREEILEKGL